MTEHTTTPGVEDEILDAETVDTETGEIRQASASELMPFVQAPIAARQSDLRDVATDSWTDVLGDVINLARGIAGTEFVPNGLRGSIEKTSAAILYGRELGLPPMTALGSVHVVEGRAGISAEAMRALILQAGHELSIQESTTSRCVILGRRKGSSEWTRAEATKAEYDQVGQYSKKLGKTLKLTDKDVWKSYPAEMLLARCTTKLARMVFADVIHGMRSTEELQDMTDVGAAESSGAAVSAVSPARTRVQRKTRPAPAVKAESEAVDETEDDQPAEPAPERKRAPRPTPRGRQQVEQPAPAPSSTVENHATPAEAPAILSDDDPATEGQIKAIAAHLTGRLGISDRDDRLYWTAMAAQLTNPFALESSKNLTRGQARTAVDRLGKVRNTEALDSLLPEGVPGPASSREGGEQA